MGCAIVLCSSVPSGLTIFISNLLRRVEFNSKYSSVLGWYVINSFFDSLWGGATKEANILEVSYLGVI